MVNRKLYFICYILVAATVVSCTTANQHIEEMKKKYDKLSLCKRIDFIDSIFTIQVNSIKHSEFPIGDPNLRTNSVGYSNLSDRDFYYYIVNDISTMAGIRGNFVTLLSNYSYKDPPFVTYLNKFELQDDIVKWKEKLNCK